MSWKKFEKKGKGQDKISIVGGGMINFLKTMVGKNDLADYSRVVLYSNHIDGELGFHFTNDNEEGYSLNKTGLARGGCLLQFNPIAFWDSLSDLDIYKTVENFVGKYSYEVGNISKKGDKKRLFVIKLNLND